MGFFNTYPYQDEHELNLDWLIGQIRKLTTELNDFVSLNTIKYADPIQWDITRQYMTNTVVIDGQTGTAYLSTKPVPEGVMITDPNYWTVIFTLDIYSVNENITKRNDGLNAISTFSSVIGDWLLWNNVLYKVIQDIPVNTAYVIGTNISPYSVENFVRDYITALSNAVSDLDDDVRDLNDRVDDIETKIQSLSVIYSTLTELINDDNIVANKIVKTMGRISENDNGGSYYEILDTAPAGYYETLNNGLFAKPIGAHNVLVYNCTGTSDETSKITTAISEIDDYIEFNPVTYTISGELVFTQDIHGNNAKIKVTGDILTAILTPGNVKELEVYSDSTSHVRVGIAGTSANSIIEDCYVHDLYNDDVSSPNHSVFGILLDNTDRNGTAIARRNRVNNIVGTYLISQTSYSASGIVFSGNSNVLIANNMVSNIVDDYNGDCLSVIPKVNDGTLACTIRNNVLIGGQIDAMKVSFENAQIYENTIRFTGINPRTSVPYLGVYGIRVQEAHNKITNNEIIDETSSVGQTIYGIMAMYTGGGQQPDVYIDGNTIIGTRIQILLSYFKDSRITNNYLLSSRSDTTGITNGASNSIISSNHIDVHDIADGGLDTVYTSNEFKNCLIDANIYTSRHVYANNNLTNSTINVTTNDIVNANMFKDCTTPLAFVSGGNNIITSNRFVDSTTPTIPAGNTDANNI